MSYLRPNQTEDLKSEIQSMEHTLQQKLAERPVAEVQLHRARQALRDQEPPDTTPEERDKLAAKEQWLREFMLEGDGIPMPSDEEMRRNYPGVVGAHIKWDQKVKRPLVNTPFGSIPRGAFLEWKDVILTLEKGDPDPDLANFERFRPARNALRSQLGAQIPGKVFVGINPSDEYKDGHIRTFGTEEEKELQARKEQLQQEIALLEAEKRTARPAKGKGKRSGRKWTAEERANASARAKAQHEARKAAQEATAIS